MILLFCVFVSDVLHLPKIVETIKIISRQIYICASNCLHDIVKPCSGDDFFEAKKGTVILFNFLKYYKKTNKRLRNWSGKINYRKILTMFDYRLLLSETLSKQGMKWIHPRNQRNSGMKTFPVFFSRCKFISGSIHLMISTFQGKQIIQKSSLS